MPRNELGKLRRSSVVSIFGPGSIVDFRAGGQGGAPVSVVAAGLDEWDKRARPPGLRNPQTIYEPRLQKKLKVGGFRLPPVVSDNEPADSLCIPGVRFPSWLQCPQCNTLKPASSWNRLPGDPAPYCGICTANAPGRQRVHVVPVRFITACEHGHLDEFPWHFWIHHRDGCTRKKPLRLTTEGAGLAGLILSCTECGARRNMEGVFSRGALTGLKCRGRLLWLSAHNEECNKIPRVLQRGASNLYFPVIHSALDIPPWSDSLQKLLGMYWDPITQVHDPEHRRTFIQTLLPMLGNIGMTGDELAQRINERLHLLDNTENTDLRRDEYYQLTSGEDSQVEADSEFEIRQEKIPSALEPYLDNIVRVVRLREVRAISGFTRIYPPDAADDNGPVRIAPIRVEHSNWLPAVEVRGEGIFLSLNKNYLMEWEQRNKVDDRAKKINSAFEEEWQQRTGDGSSPERKITPRVLLVHSLSHALMRQLALECGYSTASLRERLYVEEGDDGMCGVLIFTATPDADGTLGGLVRQGLPNRLEELLVNGLRSIQWCSSDPLCIQGMTSVSEAFNLAACHSCLLAPETSCEEFNRFLDRAMLVGHPDQPNSGYFEPLVQNV